MTPKRLNFERERYTRTPTLADADAWLAYQREREIAALMNALIGSLYSLFITPPDKERATWA